jgi:hypothetical protein
MVFGCVGRPLDLKDSDGFPAELQDVLVFSMVSYNSKHDHMSLGSKGNVA